MKLLFLAFSLHLLAAFLYGSRYASGDGSGRDLLVSILCGLMALGLLSTLLNELARQSQ